MELGAQLPVSESQKMKKTLSKAVIKVWLTTKEEDEKIVFADSNTDITKGLISLLIRVLSGRRPEEILHAELDFIDKIGMGNIIGSQRSNGLAAMIKQMKLYALAYQTKQNA